MSQHKLTTPTAASRFSNLSKKSLNVDFLSTKPSQRQITNKRRASAPSVSQTKPSFQKQKSVKINPRFLQQIQNRVVAKVPNDTDSATSEDDVFNVNYALFEQQQDVNEHLLNTLKNENFDMYSQRCLSRLQKDRQRHIKKAKTVQNEAMLRNQYIKKQLVNVQLLNQREHMEQAERELKNGGMEARAASQMRFTDMMPFEFAEAVGEHRARLDDYQDATANKWQNRRALQATLVHSKNARYTYQRAFGAEQESRPMSRNEYGSVDVRAETEKLLARTRMLLEELEG